VDHKYVDRMKSHVRRRLIEFWEGHKDFDDRNPKHIAEAEEFLRGLMYDFPPEVIRDVVEELRKETEEAVKMAREKFYEAIRKVNEGGG